MAGVHNAITMFYLTTNGEIWAWGRGEQGQLGNGSTEDSFTPVQVHLENIVAVVTGGFGMNDNIFALDKNGVVYAWGFNFQDVGFAYDGAQLGIFGSLGLGDNREEFISTPTPLNLPRISNIITGEFGSVFAITENGDVFTWGGTDFVSRVATYNEQPIPGTMASALSRISAPTQIPELSNIVQVFADGMGVTGSAVIHAVDSNGDVWVWGGLQGNLGAMLGELNESDATLFVPAEENNGVSLLGIARPIKLTNLRGVEQIIDANTLLMQSGARWSIDNNRIMELQLGNEHITDHISAFIQHHNDVSIFLDSNGYIHQPFLIDFWPSTDSADDGTITPSTIISFDPNPLRGVYNVNSIVFARPMWNRPEQQPILLYMKNDGTVWLYEVPNAPMQFNEILGAISLQVIDNSIFVILDSGDIWAWGNNRGGRLGMGFAEDSTPETVVENPVLIRFD